MKKFLKFSISLIMITILTCNMIYGHSERVHQYIVREAFKLLQMQIGRDIPRMAAHVGTTETNGYSSSSSRGSDDYSSGKIVCGAFREDVTDILWGYGNAVNPITQHWLASVTHF